MIRKCNFQARKSAIWSAFKSRRKDQIKFGDKILLLRKLWFSENEINFLFRLYNFVLFLSFFVALIRIRVLTTISPQSGGLKYRRSKERLWINYRPWVDRQRRHVCISIETVVLVKNNRNSSLIFSRSRFFIEEKWLRLNFINFTFRSIINNI